MIPGATPAVNFDGFVAWYCNPRKRKQGGHKTKKAQPPRPATVRTRVAHLRIAARIMAADDEVLLATLLADRDQVDLLLEALSVRMSSGSQQNAVYALLAFAEYGVAKGWITEPAIGPADVPPKNPPPAIVTYTDDEVEAFVSAARGTDLRWWALLAFLADTGRRIGEALSLQWEWFRLEASTPYIELPWQKNGNPQYIPMGERLVTEVFTDEHVGQLKQPSNRLRDTDRGPFPYTYSSAHARFARFCERTGLPNRGFHNFRHTYITGALMRGVPLQAVSTLVGHANPGVTQTRYNHLNALMFSQFVK